MPNIGISIDLYSRYQRAFGYASKVGATALHRSIVNSNVDTFSQSKHTPGQESPPMIIQRGDSTFANLSFEADGRAYVFGLSDEGGVLQGALAPPLMVSFSREKNIKTTVIDNSDYEVVESFGAKTWDITMSGILVDFENHWYPADLVKLVVEMHELNATYKVVGDVFNDLNIYEVYFTDLSSFSLVKDFNDTVKFSLKAKSIKPAEFFIF